MTWTSRRFSKTVFFLTGVQISFFSSLAVLMEQCMVWVKFLLSPTKENEKKAGRGILNISHTHTRESYVDY